MTIQKAKIEKIINAFQPISLVDIDKVKLMDRVDQKFTIELTLALKILQEAQQYYSILEIGKYRLSPYISHYFDFPDLQFFQDHHSKKANRYKIRHRHYVSSNLSFFEIKFKNNKGRTIKSRIEDTSKSTAVMQQNHFEFIQEKTGLDITDLIPTLNIFYQRITLVNHDLTERVTIDFDLKFEDQNKSID